MDLVELDLAELDLAEMDLAEMDLAEMDLAEMDLAETRRRNRCAGRDRHTEQVPERHGGHSLQP